MNNKTIKIEVLAKRIKVKDSPVEFTAFSAKMASGKWCNVKFKKEILPEVEKQGLGKFFINVQNHSEYVSMSVREDGRHTLWVNKVDSYEAYVNENPIGAFFIENDNDEIPF